MKLNTFTLGQRFEADAPGTSEMAGEWFTDDVIRWIQVTASETEEMWKLLEPLGLHEEVKEAASATENTPQVISFEHQLFVRLSYLGVDGKIRSLRMISGPTALVTLQTEPIAQIESLSNNLVKGEKAIEPSVAELFLEIAEATLREARPASRRLREEVRLLSESLESDDAELSAVEILGSRGVQAVSSTLLKTRSFVSVNSSRYAQDQLTCQR